MRVCSSCLYGQHDSCINSILDYLECECSHDPALTPSAGPPVGALRSKIGESLESEPQVEEVSDRGFKRRLKSDSAVTDQQSTGRKRAATLYPLKDENGKRVPCDLANKSAPTLPNYMEVQIDGCGVRTGTLATHAQARHHNDYNTLNNERENVLLLCHSCHNTLHAKNDPYKDRIYERIFGFKPAAADLSHAAKALRSGVVAGGKITDAPVPQD